MPLGKNSFESVERPWNTVLCLKLLMLTDRDLKEGPDFTLLSMMKSCSRNSF